MALVWFRRDLRVHDHPPLRAALDAHERVVPVFVLDERLLALSPSRSAFMLDCLRELRDALRARGGELFVRAGRPEVVLPELARETGSRALYYAPDVAPFARARDRAVEDAIGVPAHAVPGNFIAEVAKPYVVFTPFWRAWARVPRREVHGAPRKVPVPSKLAAGPIPTVASELPDPLPAGEKEARRRMRAFDARDYEARHDRVAGGTSMLSPYLHFGCLSARELEQRVPEPAFTRQLAWRDFYAQVLLHHPGNVRRAFRPELDAIEWTGSDSDFAAWTEGRTGFPLVDAGMRQLAATGWMHNRARLVAASFLTKDLHVDWRRGEAHFMRLLLDGDVAQNNGNWQWVTSVGVDPAPMQRRLYNPELQRRRHDRDEAYVRRWIPELDDAYPEPIVDHAVERRAAIAAYRAAKL